MSTLNDFGIVDFSSPSHSTYTFNAIDHAVCCDAVKVLKGVDMHDEDNQEIIDRKIDFIRSRVITFPMRQEMKTLETAGQVSDWKPEVITTSRFRNKPPRSPADVLNLEARLTYTETDICFVILLHNLEKNQKHTILTDSVPHPFMVLVALDACMFAITERIKYESK